MRIEPPAKLLLIYIDETDTWGESRVPLYEAIVEKLNDALVRALESETVRENLLDLGASIPEGDQRTPQALADLVKKEVARWTSVVKAAGFDLN